jgi:hypothetical protein
MKMNGGVELEFQPFLTSALEGGELSASRSCRFIPAESLPAPSHFCGATNKIYHSRHEEFCNPGWSGETSANRGCT